MKAKKVKLADVLWDAANKHLSPTHITDVEMKALGIFNYSCCSVLEVLRPGWYADDEEFEILQDQPGMRFLQDLGCAPETDFFIDSYPNKAARQGARYMWLLLAMHVAEDEGIEIEFRS